MNDAVLLMAHGAPHDDNDVEAYVLRVRHGRPLAPEMMATIRERYRQIGGSPLLHWTQTQASLLQRRLSEAGTETMVYFGMRHSQPFISETVSKMIHDGVSSLTAICLAPQFSNFTIGAYQRALDEAIAAVGRPDPLKYSLVRSYAKHPLLIDAFADRLTPWIQQHPEATVIFTAHSLPARSIEEGDPYNYEVKETARLVAARCHTTDWLFGYQSQGMTSEKWMGPPVERLLERLAVAGKKKVIVAPIGFVCDHVEILYDVDVLFKEHAARSGLQLYRPASLNDSPLFIELLKQLASPSP